MTANTAVSNRSPSNLRHRLHTPVTAAGTAPVERPGRNARTASLAFRMQKLRQLRHVGGDPPRLVFREQLRGAPRRRTQRQVCYIEMFNVEPRPLYGFSLRSFVLNQRAGSCFVWLRTKQREFHRHVERHY